MKLLAIDYSNLIIRHAANPYNDAEDQLGRPVSGPVGAARQIIRLLQEHQPTHVLLGRDGKREDNFRRTIDEQYKAHRPPADENIKHQFVVAYQMAEHLAWPCISEHRYEADDVIASAATAFPGQVLIVTGDKDLLALCSDRVNVLLLRPGEVLRCGPTECQQIFKVRAEQVCDYKALVGDPSDGISGVSGIGNKTALTLLEEYGSLERIVAAAQQDQITVVKAAMVNKLKQGLPQAQTSYQLATLVCDLQIDLQQLKYQQLPSDQEVGDQLSKLGLGDLRSSLPGGKSAVKKPVSDWSLDSVLSDQLSGQ